MSWLSSGEASGPGDAEHANTMHLSKRGLLFTTPIMAVEPRDSHVDRVKRPNMPECMAPTRLKEGHQPLGHLMMYAHAAADIILSLVVFQSIVESKLNCVVSVDMMSWCRRSHEEGALSLAAAWAVRCSFKTCM
jgi:hypothetical protein